MATEVLTLLYSSLIFKTVEACTEAKSGGTGETGSNKVDQLAEMCWA